MIRFKCPHCRVDLRAPNGTEGRWSKCKCGLAVMVPGSPPNPIPTAKLIEEANPFSFAAKPPPIQKTKLEPLPRYDDQPPPKAKPRRFEDDYDDDDDPPPIRRRLRPGDHWGLMGMMFGVIAIIASLFGCIGMIVGIPTSTLAIIFSSLGLRREGRGMAIAGLIMGTIGLVFTIIWIGWFCFVINNTVHR